MDGEVVAVTRAGHTLIELMVTLIVAAIAIGIAWDVFATGSRQAHLRLKESDTLQEQWRVGRSHWRWRQGPDSMRGVGDEAMFRF